MCSTGERIPLNQRKIILMITLIVAVVAINMCLEFFSILDLIFLFWEVKKVGGGEVFSFVDVDEE